MKILFLPVAFAATFAMPAAAYALTCADYASPQLIADDMFGAITVMIPADLAAGDTVTISISWQRNVVTPATATLTVADGLTALSTVSLTVGDSGGFTNFPAVTVNAAVDYPDAHIAVPNTNMYNTYSVRLACTPATPGGGGDGGDDGGDGEPAGSAALTTIQQGQAQATARRSADMITGLAQGGIDTAFAGGDDSSIMAFGYSGSAIIDVTPSELASSGFSLWTGARYDFAIPQAGQWNGGQAALAGGLNYRVDERWIAGVFAAYDQAAYERGPESLASRGLALGVTAAFRLDDTWRIEMIGTVERLRYDLGSGGVTGSFDATRVTLDGALKGVIPIAAQVDFVPSLAVMILREDQAGYTDSAATVHAANTTTSGELSAGGHVVFYPTGGTDAVFSVGGRTNYTIATTGGGFSASVDAGVTLSLGAAAKLSLNTALNGIGGPAGQSVSVQARLGGAL